jgi:ATP-dependent RNA helicase DHX8/PRP22
MDALEELEYLSLINRLTRELHSHLGINERVLAEFLVDLHRKANGVLNDFRTAVASNGASISDELVWHIFGLISDLDPKQRASSSKIIDDPVKSSTGASIPNNMPQPRTKMERNSKKSAFLYPQRALGIKDRKRLSSPERFEIRQLIASGAVSAAEYLELVACDDADDDFHEQVEIERVNVGPAFLKGHDVRGLDEHSNEKAANRIIRKPEGSLARTAATSAAHLLELREVRRKNLDCTPKAQIYGRSKEAPSKPDFRQLPVHALQRELTDFIRMNQTIIVVGDTGSGKTTQITQFIYEANLHGDLIVGCTQPRRVAAMSVAERVSQERGCTLGSLVGYCIRFEDCTSSQTRIKYMTDGMLLRECITDPLLSKYKVIMLDEAHERTIHTDVLMGLLKQAAVKRPELKLIITSATLDADRFSKFFNQAPVFNIPGRTFPVDIIHEQEPVMDYLDASISKIIDIHNNEPPGDILVFLTGQDEIELLCDILRDCSFPKSSGKLDVLPVYSALPGELQNRIFLPAAPGTRKVVVATNIAETSITIDGIVYVVDPGFCKQKAYNPKLGMDVLQVTPISQAQAKQRAGRAGRTRPGKCFRLYTQLALDKELLPNSVPEIQRTNLATTVLTLKALGIRDLFNFDFMDAPSRASLLIAMENLYNLGALDEEGFLTKTGRRMAEFPLEPQPAKMLLASCHLHCSDQVLTIVAMLSVQNIFYRPRDRQDQADRAHHSFHHSDGDHLTLLTVFDRWLESGKSSRWCDQHYIQARSLRRALDVKEQLTSLLHRFKLTPLTRTEDSAVVRRALCHGLFTHVARRDPQEGFKTVIDNHLVSIHPSSALYASPPTWVIYQELVMTSKEYIRDCTAIEPAWLVEAAPTFYKQVQGGQLSKRQAKERLQPLHNRHERPNDWRLSRRENSIRR